MKTETVKIIPVEEVRKALQSEIGERGFIVDMARKLDAAPASLSGFLSGLSNPGRKVLDYFGLEKRQVLVRKTNAK